MSWQCSGLATESYAGGSLKLVPRRRDGLVNEYIAMIYFCQNLLELEKRKIHIHAIKEKLALKLQVSVFKRSIVQNLLLSVQ